jgi:hypothetical protein
MGKTAKTVAREAALPAQGKTGRDHRAPGARPAWTQERMRLDPYAMPHRVSFERADGFSYTIDRQGAVMKRLLGCGLPLSMALPAASFKGIAARAYVEEDGTMTVSLELHHHDPALCVPVLVADNLDDIAADWHCWSRMLKLPMLVVEADEIARPVREQLGAIMVEDPVERRKRITAVKRRPWFLRQRKTGIVGPVTRISGAEIIARC